MIRPVLAAIALVASAAPVAAAPVHAQPHLQDGWVRLPAVSGRPAAGYFIAHGTAKADTLVAVTTPLAERVELHSMKLENGIMKMRAEKSLPLPAKGELKAAPGGTHLMLFGLSPKVVAGTKVPLTFVFQSGAKVVLEADVKTAGSSAHKPAAGGHAHH